MSSQYRLQVDQFVQHFTQEAERLRHLQVVPLHRKVLYTVALEPLARAAFGPQARHRPRIVGLIREFSDWSDCERISLPQLQLRLRNGGRYRHRLYRHVSERIKTWASGTPVHISASPLAEDLMRYADAMEWHLIRSCTYVELFYTYRNNLVHEFREPGYGVDWSGKSTGPHYISYIDRPWELVFPVAFFEYVLDRVVANLRPHLLSMKVDPYKNFSFGSLWRER